MVDGIPTSFFRNLGSALLTLLVISISLSLLLGGASDFLFSYLLLPVVFLATYLGCNNSVDKSEGAFVFFLFFWALVVRLISICSYDLVLTNYNDMPFLSFKDDFIYNDVSSEIAKRWKWDGIRFYDDIYFSTGTYSGFPNFSALLKYYFGDSYFVPRIGNAVLSAFTCVMGYKIAKTYADVQRSRLLANVMIFSPIMLVFASIQVKDTMLLFFTVACVYSIVNILRSKKILINILFLVVSTVGVSLSRPAAIVPIFGAFLLVMIYNLFTKRNGRSGVKIFSLIVIGISLFYVFEKIRETGFLDIEQYSDTRYEILSSTTIYDTEAGVGSTGLAKYLGAPLYMAGALFTPPPLIVSLPQAETINYDSWAVLYYMALLPFMVVGLIRAFQMRKVNIIPLFLLLVYFLLKFGQASSTMSILSPRQSLSTMAMLYFMLPLYDGTMKISRNWVVFITILAFLVYSGFRLLSRS